MTNIQTKQDITFKAVLLRNPSRIKSDNWKKNYHHWIITINGQSFDCYTGTATPNPPTLDDVLYCLIMDAKAATMTFEEWCDKFDYNEDSPKAFDMYHECQETLSKLIKAEINIEHECKRFQDY